MAELSDYMENAIIDQMRNVAGVQVAVYVALFTAVTGLEADSGWSGTEVSGGSYARQLAGLTAGSGGLSSNGADITFPQASANWGVITHAALMDAVTAGHVLMWTQLDASKTINTGDTFKFNAGDLDVTID
jgi:hypothetical protein